jgi:transcriptional regulator with XRE-family HTH domain
MSIANTAAERVRALRLSQSMTLAELSARSSLPISTLSKIENAKVSLSYDKLRKLALGLSVDISYFIAVEPNALALAQQLGRRSLTRKDSLSIIETESHTYRYHATDLLNKKITPMIIDINLPKDAETEFSRHPGEEFFLVLSGEVEFCCELYAPVVLQAGDSMYFDGGMGHAYKRNSDEPARILSVCCAAFEELELVRARAVSDEDQNLTSSAAHHEYSPRA